MFPPSRIPKKLGISVGQRWPSPLIPIHRLHRIRRRERIHAIHRDPPESEERNRPFGKVSSNLADNGNSGRRVGKIWVGKVDTESIHVWYTGYVYLRDIYKNQPNVEESLTTKSIGGINEFRQKHLKVQKIGVSCLEIKQLVYKLFEKRGEKVVQKEDMALRV